MTNSKEYHIGIAPGEIPQRVLLPGDPDRAKTIAMEFFHDPFEIAKKREYWSFKGTYKNVPVAVCSTGIGCPSAAIALEELVKVGCTTFIRVGTSGAINSSIETGELVIFTGAVRDDGTSRSYVPIEFPAVANPILVTALTNAALQRGVKYRVGIGHTKDSFYSEHPDYLTDPKSARERWDAFRKAGVLATEMEAASLFVIGYLRGVKVGAACVVIGEPIEKEQKIIGKPPLDDLITVALEAIITV